MLSKFFKFQENETNFRCEIIAGATTFMTMAYIIFVQPAVLSQAGMDFGSVMVATCVASAIATFLMAILANYPIALAPAMGHNFFFVYTVCMPPSLKPTLFKLDILGAFDVGLLTVIFVLFFLDLFDTVGTLIGVSQQAGFMKHGRLPRANKAFMADAIGTIEGTLLGTSTITSYIESAAGVAAGGRTGFSSIVTGILFLAALFLFPLAKSIDKF